MSRTKMSWIPVLAIALVAGACGGVEPAEWQPQSVTYFNPGTLTEDGPEAAQMRPTGLAGNIHSADPTRARPTVYDKPNLDALRPDPNDPGNKAFRNGLCPMGLTLCDAECVDLGFDPDNCGGCGFSCATPDCYQGRCVSWPHDPHAPPPVPPIDDE